MTAHAVIQASPRPPQPVAIQPIEPEDVGANLNGPNGLELVVEMAHDLRSPLTSIMFLTESLQDEQHGRVSEDQRHALGLIYSAALGLCSAASDVLELARGGTQLTDAAPTPFSVVDVFSAVHSMILPIAREKGLEVRLVHPVPERRLGHARAISRVLLNLATNAVKYTDTGFVEIAARPLTPTSLEFSVRDTGAGLDLDPATLKTLCQPFPKTPFQVHHHFSSAGLGLAICHKLVKAMGSELQVESSPEGTRFWFTLELPAAKTTG